MAFDFSLFPVPLNALGVDAAWSTTVIELGGGAEQRNINWSAIRREYDALTGIVSQATFDSVFAHFNARHAQGYSFPLLDRSFYQVTVPAQFAVADGVNTDYQLNFNIGDSIRPTPYYIYLPITGTVTIFDAGVQKTETTHWTLPYNGATGGLVHFTYLPTTGHSLTAAFQYYIPVRYNMDSMNSKLFVWNAARSLFEGPQIPLKEVRYPAEWV